MTDEEVARFLQSNPAFFQRHPALFTELLLPDPHQGNAVSLLERQALLLRERVKALEARLSELIRVGADNDLLANSLVQWTKALLAETRPDQMGRVVVEELKRIFAVPLAELCTWQAPPEPAQARIAQLASSLRTPLCGSRIDLAHFGIVGAAWSEARSVALIPLRGGAGLEAFGLLALGSADPARFEATLGTVLLDRIGELASAALGQGARCEQAAPQAAR